MKSSSEHWNGVPPSQWDDFVEFCGFVNGSTFRTRYFFDESTYTLTPCAELSLSVIQSMGLLFVTVINFCLLERHYMRIPENSRISTIFKLRTFISLTTSILLLVPIFLALFKVSLLKMKLVFLIEYGFLSLIWFIYSLLWIASLKNESWTRSTGTIVFKTLATKAFIIILVNRWILYGFLDLHTALITTILAIQIISTLANIFEWRIKKRERMHRLLGEDGDRTIRLTEGADEDSNLFSRIFFCWTNQLIAKGGKRQLNELNDVFNLPPSLQVATIEREMVENSPTYFSDATHYSLSRSLLATYGVSFFSLALLRLATDAFTFSGPILLHLLVETFDSRVPTDSSYVYASIMILSSFLGAMFSANFSYYVQKISLKVRAATITSVYDKLTRVPLAEMKNVSSGKMTNFISTDVDCIVNFCNSFHAFWSLPVQLGVALYLLYREIGKAFLSGLIAALILIPINKYITNKIGTMSERLMHWKDLRIKMIKETMEGIKTVKMSAWERYFENMIGELRERELKYLKARKYYDAVCVYLWASAPLIITIAILATYTLVLHEKLTAAKVFTSLALVNILIMPLNAFPWVLNGLIEALVSVRRLEWFFALKNMDLPEVYELNRENEDPMTVSNANFFWGGNSSATVQSISFGGKRGQVIGITGEVGSGKSTLLLGLLGETKFVVQKISVQQNLIDDGIGYLGQERWLSRGTIRENICVGKLYDDVLYQKVLRATCLHRDVSIMPGGDSYEISDNGSSLSGGQRTRVALARALYQDNDVYLLDEPFASLDRVVADTVWKEAIEWLKSRGKLVIIATHDIRLLSRADEVILLNRDGSVRGRGQPSTVLASSLNDLQQETVTDSHDDTPSEHVTYQEEDKQTGAVQVSVYKTYGLATGTALSILIIGALCSMQVTKNGADWWLSKWTESQNINATAYYTHNHLIEWRRVWFDGPRMQNFMNDEELQKSLHFLYIYAAIAAANTIFTLIRAFLFAYGGVVAARKLHMNLLQKLLKAPLSWWDRTPAGRVINRLCSDVYTIDDNLPFQLNIFMASMFNVTGALVITLMGLPYLIFVFLILLFIYYFIQKYYRMTSVELKRVSSLTLSPLYSLLSDTVNGLVTIRSQRFVDRYARELRMLLTNNLRAQFSSLAASQWLSIRLSLISVVIVAAITITAIIQHRISGVDSGLVALAITYALSVTQMLNALLGSFIETEKEMVSVERIDEYMHSVEEEMKGGNRRGTQNEGGRIVFRGVSMRYQRNLPLALDNLSMQISAGQHVAFMGRTGSGKSSIFQALLRLVPVESGLITLDGVDITQYDITNLRKFFGVIPQAPFIFSGTFYDNLAVNCPTVDRNVVANIVRVANLESLLTRIGGLDGEIEEGGKNLSVGEKQLISVCRVLLAKPKIVLIDEATSNMDMKSHERVFSLISTHLPLATVLCILHSMKGASSFDLLITIDRGQVLHMREVSYVNTNKCETGSVDDDS